MGLTPLAGVVGPACRRALYIPSCGSRAHVPTFAASVHRMLPEVHSTHVTCDVNVLS